METDELRDEFLAAEAKLNSAFSLVNHLPNCIGYADEVVLYLDCFGSNCSRQLPVPAPEGDEEKAKDCARIA